MTKPNASKAQPRQKGSKIKPARERAARALCRFAGNPEDIQFEGKPMWQHYLAEVDIVLGAVLTLDEMDRIDGL
ncbi:hypothetical protein [Pseudotabrizicola algicola]|uniref:Uncharacterized protein n=1 Tax=Pseudotabrizicola algicola TaxID=2709381 RepID=A0A6B3RWX3_9RHOB|nr:hypothetical protein [Pseudotabrizicola algicola]NEX47642.1 hypothetical protein [Pseudotabrizicola algicola]